MDQFIEFIGNNLLLSGLFVAVVLAWAAWEVARLGRKWKELGTLEAVRLINREDPLIIDVSNSTDFAKGHINGALHMPPSRIEAGNQQLLKHKERPVLVYCQRGQVSPQMANRLVKLGFERVYALTGGLTQWVSDNQPLSRQKDKSGKKGKPRKKQASPENEQG
ncbi:rhodanese-like domain-containing protein [Wenzhouxiangella limi]|uniref:Rhodanese-like domain-containing protein n=1 Tax=Wenzhouxiangella limi TaxID=2707351 RepID=A0A845VBX7_9GAMM|nr:rhodanese-like domain-containing protein [Wenzhouxiangella limi]NDY94789.1 rhodanese-like domain-containing protein [Wenzhouxiangella limi]